MAGKRYSAKFKFQVVLEALSGEKTPGQIAKHYDMFVSIENATSPRY